MSHAAAPRVVIAGNPNSGKTTLFNALTGARAKVGNYPGVTVERRAGTLRVGGRELEIVDLPGAYSLSASSPEEQVAIDALLFGERPAAVVCVADATTLARGLYLASQLGEIGVPLVLALNMMDEAREDGVEIDVRALAGRLGVPVVPMVASRGEGLAELIEAVMRALDARAGEHAIGELPAQAAGAVAKLERVIAEAEPGLGAAARRARALWALLSIGEDELAGVPEALRRAANEARAEASAAGVDLDLVLVADRYRRVDETMAATVTRRAASGLSRTERFDAVVTHRVWGLVVFVVVMALVFQSLFSWTAPAIDRISAGVAWVQNAVNGAFAAGPLRDLVVQGVIAGVGNVLVFVPQIALLFLFIGVLEDTGYLARVAFVIDRLMARVGLHGRAFVPMLSGYACAIPAVMATRTIESRRDRLLTMLVIPLTSCSARLPVYVLVIATVFSPAAHVGPLSLGALVLLAMYLLSAVSALGAAAILRRTVLKGPRPTMVLELPPYRMPVAQNLASGVWRHVRSFLVDAGSIILALTIVMWAALSFPRSHAVEQKYAAARQGVTDGEALAKIDAAEAGEQLRHSALGRLGHAIEPAIEPMGMDWRMGIGILGAFAAREVFVSTLGIVFDIGDADETSKPLRQALGTARRGNGEQLFTPLSGVSLMVFFVFACQCMSTIAVVRRESGSWKWPAFMFVSMSVLAYVMATAVFQVGRLMGWG